MIVMTFSKQEILQIAKLARLHLTDGEVEQYRTQIGSILEYVDELRELKTDDVSELQCAVEMVNIFREDETTPRNVKERDSALENFPNREGDLMKVQAVFDNRTE